MGTKMTENMIIVDTTFSSNEAIHSSLFCFISATCILKQENLAQERYRRSRISMVLRSSKREGIQESIRGEKIWNSK